MVGKDGAGITTITVCQENDVGLGSGDERLGGSPFPIPSVFISMSIFGSMRGSKRLSTKLDVKLPLLYVCGPKFSATK